MDSIITYLIAYNQYLITIIGELLLFIVQYIPLKQMVFDDSNSPEYQKFKVDKLPTILKFEKVDYKLLLAYYKRKSRVSSLKYINVIILNAHIIKETLINFLRILILPININTSFTIYTVNSILTSLRWIYIQFQNMLQDLVLKSLILI